MISAGQPILILSLLACAVSVTASVYGIRRGNISIVRGASISLIAAFLLYTFALEIIIQALLNDDFGLALAAQNSSRDMPVMYKLAALYSDKTGSLLLWGWLIALLGVVLIWLKRDSHREIMPYAVRVLGGVQAFFLFMVTVVENVFQKTGITPADGAGMNPLLQNPGMLFHPVLLYLGFAGFAVLFAFAIGAVASRRPGKDWIESARPWTLFSWCMLGVGNLVGAWWAYVELGWGGYWAWDPVENAGLMPWLLGTAVVHAVAMQRRRSYLQMWSVLLIAFTFVFTILSPFITHGGIDSPLHGFDDSPFVPYFLGFMILAAAGSAGLILMRREDLRDRDLPGSVISREGAFLATNILLVGIVAVVLIGTITPAIRDAFGEQSAVERGFFDRSAGPMLLALVFLIGVCPLLGLGKTSLDKLKGDLIYPAGLSLIVAIIILAAGIGNWYALAAIVCGFPLFTIIREWVRGARGRRREQKQSFVAAFFSMLWSNRPHHGGYIVHIGIILITLGVIGSSLYDREKTVTLLPGESTNMGGYRLEYDGLIRSTDSVKSVTKADIAVFDGGDHVDTLHPQNNFWFKYGNRYAEAAVHTTIGGDLFVSLVGFDSSTQSATLRILTNPLIVWMWIGGGVLLAGAVFAFWPKKARREAMTQQSGGEGHENV